MVARVARRLDAYTSEPGWLRVVLGRGAGHARGLLLARVRPRRRHPALLGRPGDPGGRPPEVGVRPRRAAGGRGPALPQRLLPPDAGPRRRPARALPVHRLGRPAAVRRARRLGGAPVRGGRDRRGDRARRGAQDPGGPRSAAPARRGRGGQLARGTRDHRRPLRRRSRDADPAGDPAGRGGRPRARRGRHEPHGVPHERGPLGAAGARAAPGADARTPAWTLAEAREEARASTVFTTHTPVPAGNETFEPELARTYLEPLAAASRDDLGGAGGPGLAPGRGRSPTSA